MYCKEHFQGRRREMAKIEESTRNILYYYYKMKIAMQKETSLKHLLLHTFFVALAVAVSIYLRIAVVLNQAQL
jgi:hypothetical protein